MRIWEGLGFFTLVFMLAGYVLLALLVLAHAFCLSYGPLDRRSLKPLDSGLPPRGPVFHPSAAMLQRDLSGCEGRKPENQ